MAEEGVTVDLGASMRWQQENSHRKNVRMCGTVPIGKFVHILKATKGGKSKIVLGGLMRCASASSCIWCSVAIGMRRKRALERVFKQATEAGNQVSMLTLTVRHKKADKLTDLREAMMKALELVQGSQAFKYLRKEFGADFVRVVEVNHGRNGFHPHFHIAIIHKPGVDWEYVKVRTESVWLNHFAQVGKYEPSAERGVNILENMTAGEQAWYLTKACGFASAEVVSGRIKEGKEGNLSVWQLHGYAVRGDEQAAAIWGEYEDSVKYWRMFSPSRGLAAKYGVSFSEDLNEMSAKETIEVEAILRDNSDADKLHFVESEVRDEFVPQVEYVGSISRETWLRIRARRLLPEFYEAAELGDIDAFFETFGITGKLLTPDAMRGACDKELPILEAVYFSNGSAREGTFDRFDKYAARSIREAVGKLLNKIAA